MAPFHRRFLRGAILLAAIGFGAATAGFAQRDRSKTDAGHARKPGEVALEAASLTTPDGGKVEYELGTLYVPENRADPKSRLIGVGFARFRALQSTGAPPLFFLPIVTAMTISLAKSTAGICGAGLALA